MPCCGQNREKAQAAATAPAKTVTAVQAVRVAAPNTPASAAPSGPIVKLHYTGVAAVRVRGPQTGRTYEFSGAHPNGAVERRDVEGLMRIGLFRRAV
jgi:hypothetical protein